MASSQREPTLTYAEHYDLTPLPDSIPKVKEVGASSAPLVSASFFIGARCRPYGDDYFQCKELAEGRGELECMAEGRRVTRCARSVIHDINKHCLEQFRAHWKCLDENNLRLFDCRAPEWKLNQCVFDNLGLVKEVPDTPKDEVPVWMRSSQTLARTPFRQGTPWHPPDYKGPKEPPALAQRWFKTAKEHEENVRSSAPKEARTEKATSS